MSESRQERFIEAFTWLKKYDRMPVEEEGEEIEEIEYVHGLRRYKFETLAERFGMEYSVFVAPVAASVEAVVRALWRELGCVWAPVGVDFYVLDLSYRFNDRIVKNWLRFLLGDLPMTTEAPLDRLIWERLKERYGAEELLQELSALCYRRMKSTNEWTLNRQRLVNRNTQALQRAKKMYLEQA
jgi:hypothetical protein